VPQKLVIVPPQPVGYSSTTAGYSATPSCYSATAAGYSANAACYIATTAGYIATTAGYCANMAAIGLVFFFSFGVDKIGSGLVFIFYVGFDNCSGHIYSNAFFSTTWHQPGLRFVNATSFRRRKMANCGLSTRGLWGKIKISRK
jgi:hypothetical protein